MKKGFAVSVRAPFPVAVSLALACQCAVSASPITFDFTGTLDQPINGTKDVSGSFTINGDPTVPPGTTLPDGTGSKPLNLLDESGSDVSITVKVGGLSLKFSNNPSGDFSAAQAGVSYAPSNQGPQVSLNLFGTGDYGGPGGVTREFTTSLSIPLADASLTNLRAFGTTPSVPGDSRFSYQQWNVGESNQAAVSNGTITSVQLVSTPEPGSIVIFSAIAIAAVMQARRSRHGRRAPSS